jgi:outer membrane protein insertion porin family
MKHAIILLLSLLWLQVSAQPEETIITDYKESATYEIGNIKVIGADFADEAAIISISGLKVGEQVTIPGEQINSAMKAIWNLHLFKDLEIRKAKTIGDVVFLEIEVFEFSRIGGYSFTGVKKSNLDELNEAVNDHLVKGRIFTENNRTNAVRAIKEFYTEKGYPNAVVTLKEKTDPILQNAVQLNYDIDKREKVKIMMIDFEGNENISDRKLKKLMAFTNEKKKLFKKSILTETGFEEDKKRIIAFYKTKGFQDARIKSDSIWVSDEGDWIINLVIQEGDPYYIRNISWEGNTMYSNLVLASVLEIEKGDIYNTQLLAEKLEFSPDGKDISGLYMDNGYLFFKVESKEVLVENDSVDLHIKIQEGQVAMIGKVSISGNTVTNEEVIRREIRTRPGERFSRAAIIRSQREIINLGYFNPEALDIKTVVHTESGTVDIEYIVEEKSNDQFELSAGWDPASNRLIGTAGISFNNISIKNFFNKSSWNPFPRGDGQQLSFRLQSTGKQYQSYIFSFTDPWLGGKKPTNLTVGGFFTNRAYDTEEGITQRYNILGGSVNLSKRIQWPDDNFISSTSINFNRISLDDWSVDGFQLEDGTLLSDGIFNNFYIKQTIARSTLNHPIFPTSGSNVSLSLQFTPPYSLFRNSGSDETPEQQYKWLEYYKARFDGEWYIPLGEKFVLKGSAKIGIIGAYDNDLGLSPFERYWFGGNGLDAQQGFTGIDLISMRGYNATSDFPVNGNGGATAFNKFSAELRFPIVKSPASTIYAIGFVEAGNAWSNISDINPFDLKRSAGLGLRVHLPMFGLLGFDYGVGFDKDAIGTGSYLSKYGKLSLILGFEPD